MAILMTCACGREFLDAEESDGRRGRCADCGRELETPRAGPPEAFADPAGLGSILIRTSGKATASLFLGLLSLVCALFAGLPAIVLGWDGLCDIRLSRGRIRGRAAARWGMALGVFGTAFVTPALVLPVYWTVREWARDQKCTDNLKQIALAMHKFRDARAAFPPAAITDPQGRPLLSWRVAILPYLGPEGQALYRQFHLKEPWNSLHNRALLDRMPAVYACPDEPRGRPPTTNYLVVVGRGGLFTGKPKGLRIEELVAGTSNWLMVTESDQSVPWTAPEEISPDSSEEGPEQGSRHPGGYHVAMADGRVRYRITDVSGNTRGAAVKQKGGVRVKPAANARARPAVPN